MEGPVKRFEKFADDVMRSAQLAAALEASGWPKPGNVHRTADFEDTTFEQFLAGSVALGPQARKAALRGIEAGLGRIGLGEVRVGETINGMVGDVRSWHRGGNTHFGACLLLAPLSVSAGYTFARASEIRVPEVRRNAARVMEATTVQDALKFLEAMRKAVPAGLGRLGSGDLPDVREKGAGRKIARKGFTLYDMMKASSSWDNVAKEWATGMEITFRHGFPTWSRAKRETGSVNIATVQTFLTILSRFPDTLIARKIGLKKTDNVERAFSIGLDKAAEVSKRASMILGIGGARTKEGVEALRDFDADLRAGGGELNPGTTADLTLASIMVALLGGERP
ncbi:MAG: triphosphoribosyl-dephospho-CoA synthase [Candidatus Brockarchaeota archaeon]|nr:triphosphoribosyl-dephospho-CoA synthase [Candidatus Brockarchaeota archaeon]